jgi:hypothetical protein
MADPDRNRPHFYELNWLGKAVYLGGTALRLSANLVDRTVERASLIMEESRAAYLREVDPNIEDAKIIEERDHRQPDRAERR